jgi:hypothetical protein
MMTVAVLFLSPYLSPSLLLAQRVKTGDWKFQNYDMNTSYLVRAPLQLPFDVLPFSNDMQART